MIDCQYGTAHFWLTQTLSLSQSIVSSRAELSTAPLRAEQSRSACKVVEIIFFNLAKMAVNPLRGIEDLNEAQERYGLKTGSQEPEKQRQSALCHTSEIAPSNNNRSLAHPQFCSIGMPSFANEGAPSIAKLTFPRRKEGEFFYERQSQQKISRGFPFASTYGQPAPR